MVMMILHISVSTWGRFRASCLALDQLEINPHLQLRRLHTMSGCYMISEASLMWPHPVLQEREGSGNLCTLQPLVAQEFHLLSIM